MLEPLIYCITKYRLSQMKRDSQNFNNNQILTSINTKYEHSEAGSLLKTNYKYKSFYH